MRVIVLIIIFLSIDLKTFGDEKLTNWIEVLYNDIGTGFVDMNGVYKKNQLINFDLLVNFKRSIQEKNVIHKSCIASYEGNCDTFESKKTKVIFFEEKDGHGKIVGSYGKSYFSSFEKGDSIDRITKEVCNSCENLNNTFFELSGVKLNEYECNLLYFFMQVETLEKN